MAGNTTTPRRLKLVLPLTLILPHVGRGTFFVARVWLDIG
jgi:hypothetical protein